MAQEVFKRYEKKYLLSAEQYQELVSRMITRMSVDQYGKHTICNVYFDTSDYRLIRASLEKPVYKEKLRLRSYGIVGEDDTVFLELKKKFDGVVYKRRVPIKWKDARKYMYYGIRPETSSQIFEEIDYARRLYQVRPAVYLAYDRIAFYGKEDPELRVTFDMNIRARQCRLQLDGGTYGVPLLERGQILMEVKIPGAMPVWMSRIFSELQIYPTSFSKYGTYYEKYIEENRNEMGGRIYA